MKKKLTAGILSVLALLCLTVVFSACGSNTKERIAAIEDKLAELADSVGSLDTDGRQALEEKLASLEEALKALNGGVSDSSGDILGRIEALEDEIDEIQLKTECLCGRHDYDDNKISYLWSETLTTCYAERGCRRCEAVEYADATADITYDDFILTAVFDENSGIPSANLDVREASEMSSEQVNAAVRYMLTNRTDDGVYCVTLKLNKNAEPYYLYNIANELRSVNSVQLTLSGIRTIYSGAFRENSYLIGLTLGEGVKTIENEAFRQNYSLKSVTLADSVESIGREAFAQCHALESITFGKGITALNSESIFYGCTDIESITFKSPITSISDNNLTWFNTDKITLTVAGGQKVLTKPEGSNYTETDDVFSGGKKFCEREFKEIIISAE